MPGSTFPLRNHCWEPLPRFRRLSHGQLWRCVVWRLVNAARKHREKTEASLQNIPVSPYRFSRGTIQTSGNCVTDRADAIGRRFHETCFADRFRAVVRDARTDGIGVSQTGYRADGHAERRRHPGRGTRPWPSLRLAWRTRAPLWLVSRARASLWLAPSPSLLLTDRSPPLSPIHCPGESDVTGRTGCVRRARPVRPTPGAR